MKYLVILNDQDMLKAIVRGDRSIGVCGSCMDARGIADAELVDGTDRGSMEELTSWTVEADKIITF